MSRPSLRRTPNLESLEIRQVLSAVVGPNVDQQFALALVNLARTNPSEAAAEITAHVSPNVQATLTNYGLTVSGLVSKMDSATAQPPLAWSNSLATAAQQQSQYEANNGVQTHQGPGEADLDGRINSAGYTNDVTYGENTYAYAQSIDEAMQSFLFDWGVSDQGHYNNLLQPGTSAQDAYRDLGVGLVHSTNGTGPLVITQDFGSQNNEGPQIIGLVYNDPNHLGYYTEGQGVGGVTIDAKNLSTGQDSMVQTWGAGGYQMPVSANGSYQVTATENGRQISSQQVNVGEVNVETDFVTNPNANVNPPAPIAPPAPLVPTPAPAPTPIVASTPVPTVSTQSSNSSVQMRQSSDLTVFQAQLPNQGVSSNSTGDSSSIDISDWTHWTAN